MMVHQFDQTQAAFKDLAISLMAYYKQLLEQGFSPEQAIVLTVDMQRNLMLGGKQ